MGVGRMARQAERRREDRRFTIMCIQHGLIIGLLCAIFLVLIGG